MENKKDIAFLTEDLLKILYHYYPIGNIHFREQYSGWKEMIEMVEDKLNLEIGNENSAINKFVNELQSQILSFNVSNCSYLNFPSYTITIDLDKKVVGNTEQYSYLRLCISLLCNYYTVNVVDEYRYMEPENKSINSIFAIYSFANSIKRIDSQILSTVTRGLKSLFPSKEYISHSILSAIVVSQSVPYREEISLNSNENSYNLYDLLFFYNLKYPHLEVLD